MELPDLIKIAEDFLRDHKNDPHQITSFRYHMEKLISEYATDIPFDALEIHELIEKREKFEIALKNANSLSNEVLIRHQLKEIEERILELRTDRSRNRTRVS